MRIAGETIGVRGAALLAVTALTGIALAAHGWSGRSNGPAPGGLSGPVRAATASPTASASKSPATGSSQGPTAASTPGPKLSSQPYASYAFQVWPGTPSAAARAAETGLSITVRRRGTGISVLAGVIGQQAPTSRYR